ncbi:hypothetical protein HPB48_010653 [Haemaphysalis longicornis]|uniref:Uncharacterized protein n=1 Tax=Haemaphysalis longicornis TaxID=44386 RepID=A0A9J6GSC2_HAELO|nr:hypothetical protein HPB48_010653 [Haemaphysalis longicornis]
MSAAQEGATTPSVYGRSKFYEIVESDGFQRPLTLIEGTRVPPIVLCDQAFPLMPNLMKPFQVPQVAHGREFSTITCRGQDEWWRPPSDG